MTLSELLRESCLLLIILVPCLVLSHRLRISSTLALIAAGMLIGPGGLALVKAGGAAHALVDLALVLVMFMVGAGLNPRDIGPRWAPLVGLGLAQVLVCGAVLAVACTPIVDHWEGALVMGTTLAMSSTALGLQTLRERGELRSDLGNRALAILVIQDMAVFPLMMLLPVLNPHRPAGAELSFSLIALLKPIGAVAGIAVCNRLIAAPLLRTVIGRCSTATEGASIGLAVLGSAALADLLGIPPTLGAFVAGVTLASSPERARIESSIRPYGTLLLALFFVAVGVAIDLHEVQAYWLVIVVLVAAVIILKTVVVYGLSRAFGGSHEVSARLGLLLSQGGEFGFTVATATLAMGWGSHTRTGATILLIAITLASTPIIHRFVPSPKAPVGDPQSPRAIPGQ